MPQQVELVATQTDILLGMHGAGLTHLAWLPPTACLIEVFANEIHYESMARWAQIQYFPLTASSNGYVKVDRLRATMDAAIQTVIEAREVHGLLVKQLELEARSQDQK